jgi:transposase
MRYRVIVHSAKGKSVKEIADLLGCGTATVTRARQRWREHGKAGLIDRPDDNHLQAKITDEYLSTLCWVLQYRACDFGHCRPT